MWEKLVILRFNGFFHNIVDSIGLIIFHVHKERNNHKDVQRHFPDIDKMSLEEI